MKRLFLVFFLVISLVFLFAACGEQTPDSNDDPVGDNGGNDPTPNEPNDDEQNVDKGEDYIDLCENDYRVISTSNALSALKTKFINRVNEATGVKLSSPEGSGISKQTEYEILLGNVNSRPESLKSSIEINKIASDRLSVAVVKVSGTKVIINGSDNAAINIGIEKVCEYISDNGLRLPKDLNFEMIFDKLIFSETGLIEIYTREALENIATVSGIFVGGINVEAFNSNDKEYSFDTDFNKGYLEVIATPTVNDALVNVVQANEKNGGVATINVTSKNGEKTEEYKVNFNMSYSYNVGAQVVNKGGAQAVVTFVIDDGNLDTARFVYNEMGSKYPRLRASFAVITNKLATLKTTKDENGDLVWEKDSDGNYIYTANSDVCNFWRDVISSKRFEAVSHSHTHSYWGDNDDGGVFDYTLNNGSTATSAEFPKGNVTMELEASNQILMDLGAEGLTYIKPGVGAKLSDYYFKLLEKGIEYIGARTTYTNPQNSLSMVNFAKTFADFAKRYSVKAYMVEHYNTDGTTTNTSSTAQCHNASIIYWTNYIDAAVENNGWACFCIHNIVDDTYDATRSGHFIYKSQADELFAYAERLGDKIWCATFSDAMIYHNEWSSATVNAIAYKNEYIDLTFTHEEIGDCYDMELTIRVNVLDSWDSAEVDGVTYEINTDKDTGERFILVDVAPGETVRITPSQG